MSSVDLPKEIYNLNLIELGITAFSDIAVISVEETEDYYICGFSNCNYSEQITINEFENYLIDSMNVWSNE